MERAMTDILELIRDRHSARVPYDRNRPVAKRDLAQILEAASWAPTAHNMQNFEIVAIDDAKTLQAIGAVKTKTSAVFLRENFQQLSFSEDELRAKKTGVIAAMFPPAWCTPNADFDAVAAAAPPAPLGHSLQDCPCLLLVLYDTRKRAPASEGDVLGFISAGCVMENMWLTAHALGIGLQILSVFSSDAIEAEMRRILDFPAHFKIAFGCRLGYPAAVRPYRRVRRTLEDFVHHNGFGNKGLG
jgi:nitroreductase